MLEQRVKTGRIEVVRRGDWKGVNGTEWGLENYRVKVEAIRSEDWKNREAASKDWKDVDIIQRRLERCGGCREGNKRDQTAEGRKGASHQ